MNPSTFSLVQSVARNARDRKGRVLMVGGCVRDEIMGIEPKDIDIEMYGVGEADVEAMLNAAAAHVLRVGRAFPVWKAWGEGMSQDQAVDVALPRKEVKTGDHHTDFAVTLDPSMSFAEAALRRDFTMNSIGKDPLTGELVDPHGGVRDIENKVLRHTSPHFAEDPLRVLRGMQFCARYGLTPDPETVKFCAGLSPEALSSERIFGEWSKLILQGREPSKGLEFLRQTGWVKHFPELNAIIGVPQDPEWHPEGDVWTHTKHCLDAFAARHFGDEKKNLRVGLAVLCHDFGKATHTIFDAEKGRWTAHGHEEAGMAPAETFLRRMTDQTELIQGVCALVGTHMLPHSLRVAAERSTKPHSMDAAVRRLALRLGRDHTSIDELCLVCTCDNAGRPPLPPLARAAKWLQGRAEMIGTVRDKPKPLLLGRDLIALGHQPSPAFKNLLGLIFERQLDGDVQDHAEALAYAKDVLAGNPVAGAPLETITLFRGGPEVSGLWKASWSDGHPTTENTKAATGRWFTDNINDAEWYVKNEYFDGGRIYSVTLPLARAEFYRVANLSVKPGGKDTPDNPRAFSRRPESEFFLPPEIASQAKPVVPSEPTPLSAR